MTTTIKDIEREIKELNERTKQGYSYNTPYGNYHLYDKNESKEFGNGMTKGEFYQALYMMNRVLANEEYGDITFKHETIEPEPINPEGAKKQ